MRVDSGTRLVSRSPTSRRGTTREREKKRVSGVIAPVSPPLFRAEDECCAENDPTAELISSMLKYIVESTRKKSLGELLLNKDKMITGPSAYR